MPKRKKETPVIITVRNKENIIEQMKAFTRKNVNGRVMVNFDFPHKDPPVIDEMKNIAKEFGTSPENIEIADKFYRIPIEFIIDDKGNVIWTTGG